MIRFMLILALIALMTTLIVVNLVVYGLELNPNEARVLHQKNTILITIVVLDSLVLALTCTARTGGVKGQAKSQWPLTPP